MCLSDQRPGARRRSTYSGPDRYGQRGGHGQAERPLASARQMQAREEPSWCARMGQSTAGRAETEHRGQAFKPCKLTPVPFSFFSRSPCLLHSVLKDGASTCPSPAASQNQVWGVDAGPRTSGPEPRCGSCARPPDPSVHSLPYPPGMWSWKV